MSHDFSFGCVGDCPYFNPVKGNCTHADHQLIASFLQHNPAASCPIADNIR